MFMVKPGMPYLDIVRRIKSELQVPTLRLSGEWRVRDAQGRGAERLVCGEACMLEALLSFKRAGCGRYPDLLCARRRACAQAGMSVCCEPA